MNFSYEMVRLWERPAAELLAADLDVVPLAMLGRKAGRNNITDLDRLKQMTRRTPRAGCRQNVLDTP